MKSLASVLCVGLAVLCGRAGAWAADYGTAMVTFTNFVCACHLGAADAAQLRAGVEADLRSRPEHAAQYAHIATATEQLARITSPVDLASDRREIYTRIFNGQRDRGRPDAFMRLVTKYTPVVATNPQTGAVLTKTAVDSMADALAFTAQLADKPELGERASAQLRAEMGAHGQALFAALSHDQQGNAVDGERRWAALRTRWPLIAADKRRQFIEQLRAAVRTPDDVMKLTSALEDQAEVDALNANIDAQSKLAGELLLKETTVHWIDQAGSEFFGANP